MEDSTQESQDNVHLPGSTTNFVSDANVHVGEIQLKHDIGTMFRSMEIYKQQDICEFLRKPVAVRSGTFTTTDTGIMENFRPYYELLTRAVWANKIAGHLAIRADLHIRLVLNATRFQQGRYCLAWYPSCGAEASSQYNAFFNLHCANLTNRTQLPHVEIDLNRDTECSMIIPFTSAYSHKIIKQSMFTDPGSIIIFPYSALQAPTGSTTAFYTLYMHWENVILDTPTQPQLLYRDWETFAIFRGQSPISQSS